MIFVILGTHEQGFDRLVKRLDELKASGEISDDILIQGALGSYRPKYCSHKEIFAYGDLCDKISKARIVITHGGPGSIFLSMSYGKIPIAIPRQYGFGEHVDDHQVRFVKKLQDEKKILVIYNIDMLLDTVRNYDSLIKDCAAANSMGRARESLMERLDQYCSVLKRNRHYAENNRKNNR